MDKEDVVCVCVCVCVCVYIYVYIYMYIYIYTVEYYSTIEENEIIPFAATWMDLEIIILSQRKTNIIYHLYVDSKKIIQMNLCTKQKHTHRQREQTYGCQRGKGRRTD